MYPSIVIFSKGPDVLFVLDLGPYIDSEIRYDEDKNSVVVVDIENGGINSVCKSEGSFRFRPDMSTPLK